MKILIVDDDRLNCKLLEELLLSSGYTVEVAQNGIEALEKLRDNLFHVIISDILMPEMDGFELCKIVKGDEQFKDIIFIFYSATYTESGDEDLAYSLGADAYLRKPLKPQSFLEKIKELIDKVEKSELEKTGYSLDDDKVIYQKYSERLGVKLEKKIRDLQKEIHRRRQAEEERDYFFEMSRDLLFIGTLDGRFRQINGAWQKILGLPREEILKSRFQDYILEDEIEYVNEFWEKIKAGGNVNNMEIRLIDKLNKNHWFSWSLFPLFNIGLVFGSGRDITEEKQTREELKASLKEKEVMLKEIHHRVKNNLQVISSLLHLQSGYVHDVRDKELFLESRNRIQTMAMIHDNLYRSKNLSTIDFSHYAEEMVKNLSMLYLGEKSRIRTFLELEPIVLSVKEAIPFALILNELISNVYKHAYPSDFDGDRKIVISIKKEDTSGVCLTVRDHGIGIGSEKIFDDPKTLGLKLVKILTEQLDGKLEYKYLDGSHFRITFSPEQE